jgi:hypothetical protein
MLFHHVEAVSKVISPKIIRGNPQNPCNLCSIFKDNITFETASHQSDAEILLIPVNLKLPAVPQKCPLFDTMPKMRTSQIYLVSRNNPITV